MTKTRKTNKEPQPAEYYFYTAAGLKVEFEPISLVEQEMAEEGLRLDYLENGEPLDPPTYDVIIAGGTVETHPHDKTTLEVAGDEEQTAENKADWMLHKQAVSRLENETNELRTDMILEALKVELPEDDSWEKRQRKYHIRIPKEEDEKLKHYILTIILKSTDDLMNAIQKVMALSAKGLVEEDEIAAAMRTFRDRVQETPESEAVDAGTNNKNTGEKTRTVDTQSETE